VKHVAEKSMKDAVENSANLTVALDGSWAEKK
jgi:hypothetical protein